MVITPPNAQLHIELLLSAGMLAIITVGDPGAQGATVTGVQGMGVSTPSAAAVADATAGFARLMHMPNGGMFTNGLLSMIVAAGMFVAVTLAVGKTFSALGAAPKLHCIIAPVTTSVPMART